MARGLPRRADGIRGGTVRGGRLRERATPGSDVPVTGDAATVGRASGARAQHFGACRRDDGSAPRRADACVRFAETKGTPAGDATLTNACGTPVEVTLCYRGAGSGAFDCAAVARGRHTESLAPGATRVLPEYRRGRNRGIAMVACKGALGTVFPKLDDTATSGCYP